MGKKNREKIKKIKPDDLAYKIGALLRVRVLTIDELAQQAGLSRGTIRTYLHGGSSRPHPSTLEKLQRALASFEDAPNRLRPRDSDSGILPESSRNSDSPADGSGDGDRALSSPISSNPKEGPTEDSHKPTSKEPTYDAFLGYGSTYIEEAGVVAELLERRDLRVWTDFHEVPPGQTFQAVLQRAIPEIGAAVFLVGPSGLTGWQLLELRTFLEQFVNRGIPIIPALLPGVEQIPPGLDFFNQFQYVRFKERVDEPEVINKIIWGIKSGSPA